MKKGKTVFNLLLAALLAFLLSSATAPQAAGQEAQSSGGVQNKRCLKLSQVEAQPTVLLAGKDSRSTASRAAFEYPKCSLKVRRYFLQRYSLVIGAPVVGAAFILLLLHSGLAARIRDLSERLSGKYPLQVFCTAASYYLLIYLVSLPLIFYSGYLLEHLFDLSNQTLFAWASDEIRRFLLGSLIIPLSTVCLLLMRKFERGWHFPVWSFISLLLAGITFLEPVVVEPAFNKFTPMSESSLKSKIEWLSHKAGVENPLVLVADKSRSTRKINAYVSGISSSTRIVLFDNLIREVPEDQVMAVVAHELGHYRHYHVLIGLVLAIAGLYPLILLAEMSSARLISRFPPRWAIRGRRDPVLLAVWSGIVFLVPLFISPVDSSISRAMEADADAYSLDLTGEPLASARLLSTLSKANLADPDPPAFIEFWFYSHPSIKHRIDYALSRLQNLP